MLCHTFSPKPLQIFSNLIKLLELKLLLQSWQHSSHTGANGKTEKRRKDEELQHIASEVQIIFSHTTGSLSQPILTLNSSSVTNPPNRVGLKTFNIPGEIIFHLGTIQPKQFSHPTSVIICCFPSLYHT